MGDRTLGVLLEREAIREITLERESINLKLSLGYQDPADKIFCNIRS